MIFPRRHIGFIAVMLMLLSVITSSFAAHSEKTDSLPQQHKIEVTRVDIDENAPQQPRLHFYDKHGDPLEEPVYFLADLDTVSAPSAGPVYPTLTSASIGFNFADAIMMLAGQKHAGFDLQADLSLYNWFSPLIQLGIGYADANPDYGKFHFVGKPSLYAKVGFNYNFLYKSNPDYQAFIGLRAGFSHFRYDITDISESSDYWQEAHSAEILNQKATSWYGEALAGLRVKIVSRISLGWTFGYNFKFHTSAPPNAAPWYIPGYGASSPIHVTFSIFYTIPLQKKENLTAL